MSIIRYAIILYSLYKRVKEFKKTRTEINVIACFDVLAYRWRNENYETVPNFLNKEFQSNYVLSSFDNFFLILNEIYKKVKVHINYHQLVVTTFFFFFFFLLYI